MSYIHETHVRSWDPPEGNDQVATAPLPADTRKMDNADVTPAEPPRRPVPDNFKKKVTQPPTVAE